MIDSFDLSFKSYFVPFPLDSGRLIFITSAPRSASSIPQNGPGPIPANSKIFIPFSGPIKLSYSKAFIFSSKIGNKVNDTKNAKDIASAVKIPK